MRLHSVSLYNLDADVLWLSEGALGPDEHNVVIEAIETQKNDKSLSYYEFGMEDGRIAVFLPIRGPRNDLAGTVMILADMKSMNEATMERIVTPQVRTILVKIAMFMRKNAPASAPDAPPEIAMPGAAAAPAPVNLTSTTVIEKLPAQASAAMAAAAAGPTLGPREVEQILELELVAEPPRAAVAEASPAAAPAGKAAAGKGGAGTAAKKAPPAPPVKINAKGSATAAPAAARGTPTLAAVTMPSRDVEVLAFEPDIQVPTVKPAAAAPAEIEVLAFEVEPPVVSAPPPEVPVAPPAPPKPVATGSTSSVRAINVTPPTASTSSVRAINAAASSATSTTLKTLPNAAAASSASAPSVKAAPAAANTPASNASAGAAAKVSAALGANASAHAPSGSAHAADAKPAARPSKPSISSTQTAAVQIVSDDDDVPHLISDTGPVPVLAQPASDVEAAPELPPLEPLSVEESAADLTLFAQELIKLRSSGRTRRYEVLARSQRDAHRNEVPAAFVAESARGKDGAALDAMVVERLLTWLGKHGEAIWDSEPASFSVNLSIGAIEDESFPQRIEQWLTQHSIPAEYIGFEITEFACVQCKPAVQRFVDAIEKMGCFLVIDNFSFDSAIFEMLGSKALRHVKLDPKVTTAAMKDKLPQALVVAILQACKVLGVHCVAKRVESQSSMQWLTAVGCDFAQSFSLHKPLPLEALASGQPIKALRE
jgi:EAL domain-containing protein (putative c-di-GMP-specific phosphodiesterase class I)